MKINYRSVYHLLDNHYTRKYLNKFIENDLADGVLDASIMFAHAQEDYNYLAAMVQNRESNDKDFVFFTNYKAKHPVILEKDKHLTLLEFAILCRKTNIDIKYFADVVEAQAQGMGPDVDAQEKVRMFTAIHEHLTKYKEVFAGQEK